jgi:hypothetical protein
MTIAGVAEQQAWLPPEKLRDLVTENFVFRGALFRQHAS